MKTYWIEVTKPPYPVKGYEFTVYSKKPNIDSISPSMVEFVSIEAYNKQDAIARLMIQGIRNKVNIVGLSNC